LKKIIITIDGHSACGKSTLAKALANELNYGYIDTGAMYRAVTFFFLENRVNIQKTAEMERALRKINITFKSTVGGNRTYLNGKDVEDVIRKMFVSKNVSHVAAISPVRRMVVKQQVEMGKFKGIVMEGRDIGTVVFPKAELKIFLTADEDVRTNRRYDELIKKGQKVSIKSIKDNLRERDYIDSTRKDSPLKKAQEAVLIDNSNITQKEQLRMVLALSNERIRTLSIVDKKITAAKSKPEPKKNIRPTASKNTNQPTTKNQKVVQKNSAQNQSNKKTTTQKTKSTSQKRTNPPTTKNQKVVQKNSAQNQSNKKTTTQKTKSTSQKRTNPSNTKNQKVVQKNSAQNQSNKKATTQNIKSTPQKRTNPPTTKNQKVVQKNSLKNQSNETVTAKNEKTYSQKKSNQPIAKNQNSAQQDFLKIQGDKKPVKSKAKPKATPKPKAKAKQSAKKVVQKKPKPTPTAKKKPNNPAPKNQKNEQKKVSPKPKDETSNESKKKKVRSKRSVKK